jgi:hypothetical protein
MSDEEKDKPVGVVKNVKEPTGAPELPEEMKLKIVDNTASTPDEVDADKESANTSDTTTGIDATEVDAEDEQGLGDEEQVMGDDESPKPAGKFKRFFKGFWRHKKWTLPLLLLVIIGALVAVPASRYPLLATFMKRTYAVTIVDSKTNTPVSGAEVRFDTQVVSTNSEGQAKFTEKVGKHTLKVSKKYYKDFSEDVFVGIRKQGKAAHVALEATGRQVPIKVVNNITGKTIRDAEVKVLDTEAKTDADGMATIVLPTSSATEPVKITATGYNTSVGKIQVTDKVVAANTFSVTPSGRVYFLSNSSGNIDVVSANLDGTSRKTVLGGTGREDSSTVLLVSHDWKYLALLSKRDGGQKLYLIDTVTGNDTVMAAGNNLSFSLFGWAGHRFIYETDMINVPSWQPNPRAIKSFDADTSKSMTLEQAAAEGNQGDYAYQYFGGVRIMGSKVLFAKQWNVVSPSGRAKNKKNQIISVGADGTSRQILKEISYPTSGDYVSVEIALYKPQDAYIRVSIGNNDVFYEYKNNYLTQSNTLNNDALDKNYPTYLVSPSGKQTLWSELRDGKTAVLTGDATGTNERQVASLDSYQAYGWFTDNYVLTSKNGSELYVMSANGGKQVPVSGYYGSGRVVSSYGGNYAGF